MDVEYVFQAAFRGFPDEAARSQTPGLRAKKIGAREGHARAHSIMIEDSDELAAMLDRGDDWQSGSQIVDRL